MYRGSPAYLGYRFVILGIGLFLGVGLLIHGKTAAGGLVIAIALLRFGMLLGRRGGRLF